MKKALVGVAVVLVVGVAIWAVSNWPPTSAGKATGSVPKGKQAQGVEAALWEDLSRFEGAYLSAYAEQFEARPDEPTEVLFAFNELAYKVTGPGGLWRKTVPDKYFGCVQNEDMPICLKFKQTERTFSKWDKIQEQINDLADDKAARKFVKEHGKELQEYIRQYVPTDESFSAVQATPFFSDNLASAM
jgi:hypothetical protein